MLTLALESSCDETAAAVLRGPEMLASVVASQVEIHRPTGGVVPEVASRNHLLALRPLLAEVLAKAGVQPAELDLIAATAGPGLASSLLIGHTAAKGLALALNKPFAAINHLEGHLLSPFLGQPTVPPHLGLIVSGGHTLLIAVHGIGNYQLLGRSRDDAAGEAFDKVGKLLGLPYPGGPEIEKNAQGGNPARFDLPRGTLKDDPLAFSFSGLKTAVLYLLPDLADQPRDRWLADLCASFQHAVCEVLVQRAIAAAGQANFGTLALSGGVACNGHLRQLATSACESAGLSLHLCKPRWSTDNAAMIGYAAWARHAAGFLPDALNQDIHPNLPLALDETGTPTPNRAAKTGNFGSVMNGNQNR